MEIPNCLTNCLACPSVVDLAVERIEWLANEVRSGNIKREELLEFLRVINPMEAEKEMGLLFEEVKL
jgi:hypothetical protein